MLRGLGAEVVEVRVPAQLEGLDGLVVPGGESTAISRLIRWYELEEPIARFEGPLLGTCAGMILFDRDHLGLLDLGVERTAYGRQVASFEAEVELMYSIFSTPLIWFSSGAATVCSSTVAEAPG